AVGHVVTLGYPLANRLAQGIDDAGLLPVAPHVHTVQSEQSTRIDMLFDILQEEYLCSRPDRNALIESMLTTLLVWVRRQMHRCALEPAQAADRGRRHFSTFNELIEKHY